MRTITVFLASSNDMKKYRDAAEQVIEEFNKTFSSSLDLTVQLFRWEKNIVPQMGRPQEIIFEQSAFGEIDIFLGIIGCRFGTPTGASDENNNPYGSGTQEEFDAAYSQFQKTGKPQIMVFKGDMPIKQGSFDIEQYAKVQEFLKGFEANSSHPGLYHSFKTTEEFRSLFRVSLASAIMKDYRCEYTGGRRVAINAGLSLEYSRFGYKKLFVPQTNSLRSAVKTDAIRNSSSVDLLAKTGNSFLGNIGNRYRDVMIEGVLRGASVRLLLLNPWSYGAMLSAFSESPGNAEYMSLLMHEKASQEVIADYMNTDWYRIKLKDVLAGYEQLMQEYPEIELRFVDTEVSASVLLTDESCFYEPYSNYCKTDRLQKKVSTFEMQISCDNELYDASKQYFELLWNTATPYIKFKEDETIYRNRLANYIDMLHNNSTTYYVGVHALIRKDGAILMLKRSANKEYMPSRWDIPGGSMEPGEDTRDTLVREIKEETGLNAKIGDLLYVYTNKVELPQRQTIQIIYEATVEDGEIQLALGEHDEYKWTTEDEINTLDTINFVADFLGKYKLK